MTREEKFNDYEGFVEKFKPKKTTDDCYTPPAVYEAVPHADAPTRVWELSDREKAIIKELNNNDDERPCAAP